MPDPPNRAPPQIRIFVLYHDPSFTRSVPHSVGMQKGLIGVVHAFADRGMTGANNVVIAHEILHTLGASDKYDLASLAPLYPAGYAEPDNDPLYPQSSAEIMAGRFAVDAETFEMPESLDDVLVGDATALEIAGRARHECPARMRQSARRRPGTRARRRIRLRGARRGVHRAARWQWHRQIAAAAHARGSARRQRRHGSARTPGDRRVAAPPDCHASRLSATGSGRAAAGHGVRFGTARALCRISASGRRTGSRRRSARCRHWRTSAWDRWAPASLRTLSGGEQRRAAIARLLVQAPSIYLLDEPTNHLDPAQQLGILERLRALARAGASVIASLHDPNLALRFADRIWLLSGTGDVTNVAAEELAAAHLGAALRNRLCRDARRQTPLHDAGLGAFPPARRR